MNNKALVVGSIIFSLLIAALITRNGDIAWMMLPFLAYLGVGILQTPLLEKVRFSAGRTLKQSRSNENAFVDVNLSVQNQALEIVYLSIHEMIQAGMKITDGDLSRWAELRPGESLELKYIFTAVRGSFSWNSIRIVMSDPLGLVETEMFLPASAMIQIRPQIKKFKSIPFRPNSTLHSPGSIPARLGGSGTDFFGVREYHSGDSLRWLDWRLTARHPRKYFTKEFEQEEIAEIGLILDARQSTELRVGEESLFESSLGATASLAEMFLHQGHRVGLLVFGESMLKVFPGYSKVQLHRIMGCLSKAKVGSENRRPVSLDFIPIRMFPSRALIIIISPLVSADRYLFLRLRAYGYQALLVSPDPIDFAYPTLTQDATTRLAIRAARLERRLRLNDISQMQIPVIDWQTGQPLFPLLRNALTRLSGQRK
ncbi:MAG TPA: DUF58 domain-containing protein [Anaerolineales bacterium]|nr:DUF58 domain-containing protein [Anaerolineales bacterium]